METRNIWLPYNDTMALPVVGPAPGERVLVLVPTAGVAHERLRDCLRSAHLGAEGMPLRLLVVHCPATPETRGQVVQACRGLADIIHLEGPFNYCRSINIGIGHARLEDRWVVFLNDDAAFLQPGDLTRMIDLARANRWATIGPWIENFHGGNLKVARTNGAIRTNAPVQGACAVWDREWLDRVGPLDEIFGIGWGLDEPDICLRALRLGARYGRADMVEITHLRHATFGDDYTDINGPAHRHNMEAFKTKYGREVAPWGRSHHWEPLPGVQVSISAHNAEPWLQRCLDSVELALEGFRWVLVLGDDASTDRTLEIARHHAEHLSRADHCLVRHFPEKAYSADQAKNRVLKLGREFSAQYPAMCLMDADDEMDVQRVRHLLWRMRDGGHLAVMGDHRRYQSGCPREHLKVYRASEASQQEGGFGPWATLFHASLVPENGILFRQHPSQTNHGDVDLWLRWYLEGIRIVPFPGTVVHHYHCHPGTASRPLDPEVARQQNEQWRHRKSQLLAAHDRNLANPAPVSRDE